MRKIVELPKYHELMLPTLKALDSIGGSASLNEINDTVISGLGLAQEELDIEYDSGAGPVVPDRLSWARSHLKAAGYLASGGRGVWLLTDAGRSAISLEPKVLKSNVAKVIRELHGNRKKSSDQAKTLSPELEEADESPVLEWQDVLLQKLRTIDPAAFERLSQRLLRESNFVKVEVTGRTGDGGIDGTGILQISLMSFHILFQCKRYQGSVGSGAIRDFRGAMMGRTDKGLIITTGTFTADARREATRDGAPPIDLIDGEALCEKLKELSLGVETRLVEEVSINPDWFDRI